MLAPSQRQSSVKLFLITVHLRRDSKGTGITLTGSRAPVRSLTNPQLRVEKEMFIERNSVGKKKLKVI